MSRQHWCNAAVIAGSVLAAVAVAESSGATSDTATDTSVAASADEHPAVEILAPDESWGGATRGEWSARVWQRSASFPAEVSVSAGTTDGGCGFGQFGPVFLLRGSGVDITCVVAEGTAIFVVVADAECSTVEPPPFFGGTEEELRTCATVVTDEITDYQASVNGQEVADLDAYRTASPLFTLTFPENNSFGAESGIVAQAVSESYSFLLAPPPAGEYEVFTSWLYPGAPAPVATNITLMVEAPHVVEPPPS